MQFPKLTREADPPEQVTGEPGRTGEAHDEGPRQAKNLPGDRRGTPRRDAQERRRVRGGRGEPGGLEAPLPHAEGTSPRLPVLRRAPGTPQGDGVRVGAPVRGVPRVPAGGIVRQGDGAVGVVRRHRRRRGDHGGGPHRSRAGALDRGEHPSPVRAAREHGDGGEPASHPDEIFLHQEAALSQGIERRRPLSRRVRDDGRGVRGVDPSPDGQDPPFPRRACGRARGDVLGGPGVGSWGTAS